MNKHSPSVDEVAEFADECSVPTGWESNSRYVRPHLLDPCGHRRVP